MRHFLKAFLCLLIGCSWIPLAHAAESPASSGATAAKAAPAIEIPEASYNFGAVQQGQTIEHDFVVKNTGTAPLHIKQVRPG